MAHTREFPTAVLEAIATNLGETIDFDQFGAGAKKGKASSKAPLTLCETIDLWEMKRLPEGVKDFEACVCATGYWIHQVRRGKRAVFTIKTTPFGPLPDDWKIESVKTTPFPEKLDQTFHWVDAHVEGDPQVRLLWIPSYLTYVLWLKNKSIGSFVFVTAPDSVSKPAGARREIDPASFVKYLRSAPLNLEFGSTPRPERHPRG